MLKFYHAEPGANSLKSMIPLFEKALEFESVYVDLHKFEQHEDWYLHINPEGQVPVLDHDGVIINHTTVINEYLEDAFPDAPPLRPNTPLGNARMRNWNKFVDEHVMNFVSMHGWHRMVGVIARKIESGEFEKMLAKIPLHEQREKWRTARSGFSQEDLDNAIRKIALSVKKVEDQLTQSSYLAGDEYSLADINYFSHCGMYVDAMFPQLDVVNSAPRLIEWRERILERPAVRAALSSEDRTNPELRTFTGEVH